MRADALSTVLDAAAIVFVVLVLLIIAIAIFLPKEKRTMILRRLARKGSSF